MFFIDAQNESVKKGHKKKINIYKYLLYLFIL